MHAHIRLPQREGKPAYMVRRSSTQPTTKIASRATAFTGQDVRAGPAPLGNGHLVARTPAPLLPNPSTDRKNQPRSPSKPLSNPASRTPSAPILPVHLVRKTSRTEPQEPRLGLPSPHLQRPPAAADPAVIHDAVFDGKGLFVAARLAAERRRVKNDSTRMFSEGRGAGGALGRGEEEWRSCGGWKWS
ncbi:hypothetical protein MMC13_000841 [Lambiella insularis]|nr:hypothetical protein [Lambiella insularis]